MFRLLNVLRILVSGLHQGSGTIMSLYLRPRPGAALAPRRITAWYRYLRGCGPDHVLVVVYETAYCCSD
ncbi:hypothetical protein KSC_020450 [Ktedonobacter sp. SOSP1-52]|nr:hypothetical protein KSC_020450 [Ktedonobacter sp. SOSP1-52]